jgi:serine protease Do
MKIKHNPQFFIVIMIVTIIFFACGPTPVEVVVTATVPAQSLSTPSDQTDQQSSPSADQTTLTREQKSYLAHATVRILGVKNIGGQMQPFYNGSGTLLSSDGIILTNCHVADPVYFGFPPDQNPDALVVELVNTEDKPPIPSFYATVVAKDATLDLAVIKIHSTLDGSPINPSQLSLPTVQIGNSDATSFGDPLFVFGFPGIGGDTITYSTGSISGFDSENPIGDRAWIKTDALIAGGNSGGLATNANGEIIGVPSKLGTTSAQNLTDCRVIQDTNGDGIIDQYDSCIPTGGFINGIRPINWAAALITAANTGQTYVSPYDSQQAQIPNAPPQTGSTQQLSLVGWSEQVDSNYCPINPITGFPSGVNSINAVFSFSGMTNGEEYGVNWLIDGRELGISKDAWQYGPQGNCTSFYLYNDAESLPDGQYIVQLYAGPNLSLVGQAQSSIGGGSPQNNSGQVVFQGQVTDANSGTGLADIMLVVLIPGTNPDQWLNSVDENAVIEYTNTDNQGYFQFQTLLDRGFVYGLVIGNKQTGYPPVTGTMEIHSDAPNVLSIPFEISR